MLFKSLVRGGLVVFVLSLCCLAHASAQFAVDPQSGTWGVDSGGMRMDRLPLMVNGANVLKGARGEGNTYRKNLDGLEVSAGFSVQREKWVQVAVTVKNTTNQPIALKSLVPS